MGFHSCTTTTHPTNVNLPSTGQQVTARLSVCKVSVTGGNRAQAPLVRDTTIYIRRRPLVYVSDNTSLYTIEGRGVKFQSVERTNLLHSVLKFLLKLRWESWPQIMNRYHKNLRRSNRWSLQKIMQRTD
jgi:hypothetical protein